MHALSSVLLLWNPRLLQGECRSRTEAELLYLVVRHPCMFINTIHESSAGSSRLDAWAAELLTCRIPRAYYSSLTLTLSVCMCVCHCCNNCCVHLNIYCWKCTESPPAAWRALTRFLWLSVFWWWITHTHTCCRDTLTHWHSHSSGTWLKSVHAPGQSLFLPQRYRTPEAPVLFM